MGTRDRSPDPSRGRMAEPRERGHLRRAASARARNAGARAHRSRDRRLLLRDEGALDPRSGPGRAGACGPRRAALRDDRHVAGLEAHRRPRACHRCVERVAHDGLRHPAATLGRRAPRRARSSAGDVRDAGAVDGRRRRDRSRALRHRAADRGDRGRSAGRALRPDLLRARRGEEHLRNGVLPPREYRRNRGTGARRSADHDRVGHRRRRPLRARGERLHHRRRGAVAARRPRHHHQRGRDRGARDRARGQRRRVFRAGVHRPRRAALGHVRARSTHRDRARHHARAHRARDAREHRLPDARSRRGDGRRRTAHRRAARGWWRHGQPFRHAVPGGSARHSGGGRGYPRDDRARRRVPRRPRHGRLEDAGRAANATSDRRAIRADDVA